MSFTLQQNYGSNYGKRVGSISGLSEGCFSVSINGRGPSDLSHGDPIASLVTALSDIKLRPRTRQNNKQPSTTRDDARTHTVKCSIYVHLGYHKDTVKCTHTSKNDAILGDNFGPRALIPFPSLVSCTVVVGYRARSTPLDTKTELTREERRGYWIRHQRMFSVTFKAQHKFWAKSASKGCPEESPSAYGHATHKGALRTTSAKSASHHFSYEKRTSQPHGSTMTRPSSVWDGTVGLNELMLLFGKLTVTPPMILIITSNPPKLHAPKQQNRDQNDPALYQRSLPRPL
ncbi:hypothetical protein BU17DRAFT_96026 [Hysterangium stoloniferum]|nr:hypothetical protein BU17DRAFT_96026 [Hysterangium stoloniferum]